MCESCDETPDGQGRRCSRPDGFTPQEADRRNRARNLANAREALANGDAQAAANSLARSVASQKSLDGGHRIPVQAPAEAIGPHRDFTISPSDLQTALARLEQVNVGREKVGSARLAPSITRDRQPTEDPIMVTEVVNVRIMGASEEELSALSLGNVRSDPERKVNTFEVLAVAHAATRRNGGVYVPKRMGENSVPSLVDAYVADHPGGPFRTSLAPSDDDRRMAVQTRMWVRTLQPTSDYNAALRHSVSDDYMSLRESGTASSAIAGFQEHQKRVEANKQALSTPGAVISPRPQGSRWLARVEDKVTVVAHVDRVVPMYHPKRMDPHFLYVMRTPEGDLVRWVASSDKGLEEGDDVTVQGTIKAHSVFNGERQTELWYCNPPRIHAKQ